MSTYIMLTALLVFFASSSASYFQSLSASDAQMSEEGTLEFTLLSDEVKLNLFRDYQTHFERKVTATLIHSCRVLSSVTSSTALPPNPQYSTMDEEVKRYSFFEQSLSTVDKLNARERAVNGTAVFGINIFSDMSAEEIQSRFPGPPMPDKSERRPIAIETKFDVSYGFGTGVTDWRGWITTPVKDQHGCASSWLV